MKQVLVLGTLDEGRLLGDARCVAIRRSLPDVHLVIADREEPPWDLSPSWEAVPSTFGTVESALRDADAVVVTGSPFRRPLVPALVQLCARSRGTPVALVGVDAPVRGAGRRRLTTRLARSADLLVVRDDVAATTLAANGVPGPVRVGADPAWAVLGGTVHHRAAAAPRVTIAAPDLPHGREHLASLAGAVDALPAELSVRVLTSDGTDDEPRAAAVGASIRRGATIDAIRTHLGGVAGGLGGDRLLITASAPLAMAAAAVGTPTVWITADPADVALAERLGHVAVFPDASSAVLRHACEVALRGGGAAASAINDEVRRAGQTLDQVRALVDPAWAREQDAGDPLPMASRVARE